MMCVFHQQVDKILSSKVVWQPNWQIDNLCIPTFSESTPAGNRKRHSARAVTCPSITFPGGGGVYPILSCPKEGGGGNIVISSPGLGGGGTTSCHGQGIPCHYYARPDLADLTKANDPTWIECTLPLDKWQDLERRYPTLPALTRITDSCENITFTCTTYVVGKSRSNKKSSCVNARGIPPSA